MFREASWTVHLSSGSAAARSLHQADGWEFRETPIKVRDPKVLGSSVRTPSCSEAPRWPKAQRPSRKLKHLVQPEKGFKVYGLGLNAWGLGINNNSSP